MKRAVVNGRYQDTVCCVRNFCVQRDIYPTHLVAVGRVEASVKNVSENRGLVPLSLFGEVRDPDVHLGDSAEETHRLKFVERLVGGGLGGERSRAGRIVGLNTESVDGNLGILETGEGLERALGLSGRRVVASDVV